MLSSLMIVDNSILRQVRESTKNKITFCTISAVFAHSLHIDNKKDFNSVK